MAEENFEQLLDDLRNKKIDHFVITPRIFTISPIFHSYAYRSQIEGEAQRGGKIIYQLRER
ncbi:phospho-2-dehydro-3-deoxyheptonate aldolase [Limosilactobacillus reuteri]|nr:hypothetical protein [Limosilactobacillus reuteri]KEQ21495.1 phospho-2-dehydro-3-deoxyheptonate aldolase [Limosilactobacillus reuteri]